MRVVSGVARGRPLRAPAGRGTRPTSDRVREAMFSMLASMDTVAGATVVDLFAGSGALGVEALSRGAASATFVDRHPAAVEAIRANLEALGPLGSDATVLQVDALSYASQNWCADLVFADPPYAWDRWPELLGHLRTRAALVVIEAAAEQDPGAAWETVKVRRYGSTVVQVTKPASEGEGET
ncbi:MAG: 16S rRNA (guanine(966)-N(2))-methyltransferase RsmD [Acidimicrobiales bacterium]